jgi:hypothetical protein
MSEHDARRCAIAAHRLRCAGGTNATLAEAARAALRRRRDWERVVRFRHAGQWWYARCDWLGVAVSLQRDDNITFLRAYHAF